MGSIIRIPLLNNKFTYKELNNDEKIYVDVFIVLLLHIYRRHLSPPAQKMWPISDVPLMGKIIINFFK